MKRYDKIIMTMVLFRQKTQKMGCHIKQVLDNVTAQGNILINIFNFLSGMERLLKSGWCRVILYKKKRHNSQKSVSLVLSWELQAGG